MQKLKGNRAAKAGWPELHASFVCSMIIYTKVLFFCSESSHVGSLFTNEVQTKSSRFVRSLLLLRQNPAHFMASLMQTTEHKTAGLLVVLRRFPNFDKQDEKWSEKLLCAFICLFR